MQVRCKKVRVLATVTLAALAVHDPTAAADPYRRQKVLETYYAYSFNRWATLSFDYQLIANLGYNVDRGPVLIFSGRLHAEF